MRQLVLKSLELFADLDRYWSRAAQRPRSERQPRQVGGAPPLCLSQGLAAVPALAAAHNRNEKGFPARPRWLIPQRDDIAIRSAVDLLGAGRWSGMSRD